MRLEIEPLQVETANPFRIARGTKVHREIFVVSLTADGITGMGESSPQELLQVLAGVLAAQPAPITAPPAAASTSPAPVPPGNPAVAGAATSGDGTDTKWAPAHSNAYAFPARGPSAMGANAIP